jgi:glycerol-3-phosphate dehydrogenase
LAFRAAFKIHELIGLDRNAGLSPDQSVPDGYVLDARGAKEKLPWLAGETLTGAAVWHDARMEDAHRVLLECVLDAAQAGAEVANYIRAESLLGTDEKVTGVAARDVCSDSRIDIRARMTVNATGPWLDGLRGLLGRRQSAPTPLIKNMNLVVRRRLADYAVGFYSNRMSDSVVDKTTRLYFVTPWAGLSILGTTHFPFDRKPDDELFDDAEVEQFVEETNAALPGIELSTDDIIYRYSGLTPAGDAAGRIGAKRARRSAVVDHAALDGVAGIISVLGVKYTTARGVAQLAVDLVASRLPNTSRPCSTAHAPLPGARGFESRAKLLDEARRQIMRRHIPIPEDLELERVSLSYGCRINEMLQESAPDDPSDGHALLRCRIRFAVRREMAVRLEDLVMRRLDWAERGLLDESMLDWCASIMAKELGWSDERRRREVEAARTRLRQAAGYISDAHRRSPEHKSSIVAA